MRSPLVLSKPSGIPCFPFHHNPALDCLLYQLTQNYPGQKNTDWPAGFAGGIAHRLDVSTSGQVLVAVDIEHLTEIRALFTQKKLEKTYYFLSEKKPKWKKNTISAPLAHDRRRSKRMVVQRGRNTPKKGKWLPAETNFQYIHGEEGLHLWRARMRTGVMHQIRLHAAFLGIGLLGDRLYGGGEHPGYFPAGFALHHYGVQYSGWSLSNISLPSWWPAWTKNIDLN